LHVYFCFLSLVLIHFYLLELYQDMYSLSLFQNYMYKLVSSYQINAHFLYSITIYMLHYNPQHVLSSTLLIFRRTNCIITASGIVTLCKWPYSMPVESVCSTVRPFTESDDTRCCNNTICPPEDEQGTAQNMLRIIM
jgi:hypothetical protein